MPSLRFLVVEDRKRWQHAVRSALEEIGGEVDVASDWQEAIRSISSRAYDLAVVDLALEGEPVDREEVESLDLGLLKEVRDSRRNKHAAVLVVTAYLTSQHAVEAVCDYRVHDLIAKQRFQRDEFQAKARRALLNSRLERAEAKANACHQLTVSFTRGNWSGSEIRGPDRSGKYFAERPSPFNLTELSRRTDRLNVQLVADALNEAQPKTSAFAGIGLGENGSAWRDGARAIGNEIYETLSQDRRIAQDMTSALEQAGRQNPLWLRFAGPSEGLGVPFELLHDGNDHLGYHHVLIRQLVQADLPLTRRAQPFHRFVRSRVKSGKPIRMLIVGVDPKGGIPSAEDEVAVLRTGIEAESKRLGLRLEVSTLTAAEASYANVKDALQDGGYHLFHFAGYGHFDPNRPDRSSLALANGGGIRNLTASDLHLLTAGSDLRLVFLSACLGARVAQRDDQGEFRGILEALARAGVHEILGYRWTVGDQAALSMASVFYRELWKSFSPPRAVLEARRGVALSEGQRDDETWASLVLLSQNQ